MKILKTCGLSFSLLVFLSLIPMTVSANELSSEAKFNELKENAISAAKNYIKVISTAGEYYEWEKVELEYEFPLFDFDGNVTSFLFDVNNEFGDAGYLIVSADEKPVVIEAAREGNSPYDKKESDDKAIYVGLTQYFIETEDETYFDIREEEWKDKTELKSKGILAGKHISADILENDESTVLQLDNAPNFSIQSEVQPFTIISYSSKILSDVPDFSWRKGCSPTSFANIIWYYRYSQGYTNLLASTTTSNTLIDVLAGSSYMNTNSDGGTGWNDRVTGMTKFWSDRGYTVTVKRTSANFSNHKTEINNNRPDIINTVNDATYGNHDMTGVGYEEYQDTESNLAWFRYVIVRDTWDSTPKSVYLYVPALSWNETVTVKPS